VNKRDFITLLGGAAAAWPLAARAQQADRVRRIGALMTQAADDPEGQYRLLALAQGLQESGWTIGSNVRIETRWGAAAIDNETLVHLSTYSTGRYGFD
jgi:putative tryptophan/tyrosine transport system substrate-binding protein